MFHGFIGIDRCRKDACGRWAVISDTDTSGILSVDKKVNEGVSRIGEMLCLSAAEGCRFCVLNETLSFIISQKVRQWGGKDEDNFSVFS